MPLSSTTIAAPVIHELETSAVPSATVVQPGAVAIRGMALLDEDETPSLSRDIARHDDEEQGGNGSPTLIVAAPFDLQAHDEALHWQITQNAPRAILIQPDDDENDDESNKGDMAQATGPQVLARVLLMLFLLVPILVMVILITRPDKDESGLVDNNGATKNVTTEPPVFIHPANLYCANATVLQPNAESATTLIGQISLQFPAWQPGELAYITTPCAAVSIQPNRTR